jgi:hypothetical protein
VARRERAAEPGRLDDRHCDRPTLAVLQRAQLAIAMRYGRAPLGSIGRFAAALSIVFEWLIVSLVSEAVTRPAGRVRRGGGASPRRAAISRSISSRWALRSIRRARRCSVLSCFMSGAFPPVEARRIPGSSLTRGYSALRKADDCAFNVAVEDGSRSGNLVQAGQHFCVLKAAPLIVAFCPRGPYPIGPNWHWMPRFGVHPSLRMRQFVIL